MYHNCFRVVWQRIISTPTMADSYKQTKQKALLSAKQHELELFVSKASSLKYPGEQNSNRSNTFQHSSDGKKFMLGILNMKRRNFSGDRHDQILCYLDNYMLFINMPLNSLHNFHMIHLNVKFLFGKVIVKLAWFIVL